MWTAEPEPLPARRGLTRLMIWLIAAALALGLTVAVVIAALSSGAPTSGAPIEPAQPVQASTPSPSLSPSLSTLAPPTEGPSVSATTQDAVSELDATIVAAVDAGRMDSDAAAQLRARVNDLRNSVGKGKVRKVAQDLQNQINTFVHDGSIDQATADRLTALLQTFIRTA